MIVAIRISGQVGLNEEIKEALFRMKIRKKYAATLFEDTKENQKLLKKLRNHISYGGINEETLVKLIRERGQSLNKKTKIDAKKIVADLNKKTLKELGLKPFFRLHSPRGGIESKKHAGKGKGVLGENKKINELIERML